MRFLQRYWFFSLCYLLVTIAKKHPQEHQYCLLKRFQDNRGQKKFIFLSDCDMTALAKPYRNFPPSFFIIGVQKGGTTMWWRQLKFNTVLAANYVKEAYFLLSRPADFKSKYQTKEFAFGNYSNEMSSLEGPSMDGSAGYSRYGGLFIENLKWTIDFKFEEMPKMVFILRNPLIRLYSAWKMRLRWMNREGIIPPNLPQFPSKTTLQELLEFEMNKIRSCGLNVYLNDTEFDPRAFYSRELLLCFHDTLRSTLLMQGMYSWHLEDILRVGNPSRILVACFQDYQADGPGFLSAVAKFVGVTVEGQRKVSPGHEIEDCPKAYRKRQGDLGISPEYEAMLHSFYKKWNEVLIEDFGIDCGWNLNLTC